MQCRGCGCRVGQTATSSMTTTSGGQPKRNGNQWPRPAETKSWDAILTRDVVTADKWIPARATTCRPDRQPPCVARKLERNSMTADVFKSVRVMGQKKRRLALATVFQRGFKLRRHKPPIQPRHPTGVRKPAIRSPNQHRLFFQQLNLRFSYAREIVSGSARYSSWLPAQAM